MARLRPILLLELNEMHWPVLDRLRASDPDVDAFLARARCHTTHVDSEARLSPWITWPTLHRGLSPAAHGLAQLGQDPATAHGRPIWEDVRARGESIGIVGSLHSWPPIDPGPEGFFVPDTFAAGPECVPAMLAPLQALNLALVGRSGRVATTGVPVRAALASIPTALRLRLSPRLAVDALAQLAAERIDRERRDARPLVQAALFWNVFRRLYERAARPPAFASYFTNHVASLLHRHWADLFPEDVPGHVVRRAHRDMLEAALSLTGRIVRETARIARARPDLVVVIASSMGQGAVDRPMHHGRELAVTDVVRLLAAVGVARGEHEPGIAMVPQATTRAIDAPVRERIRTGLHALRTPSGKRIFDVVIRGESVSITIGTPPHDDVDAELLVDPSGRSLRFSEIGVAVHRVPAGTGNHVPEGALAIVGRGIVPDPSRSTLPLEDVKALLLQLATSVP